MKVLGAVLCLLLSVTSLAQNIEGIVTDHQSGEPLIGAAVGLKNGELGVITDAKGFFQFNDLVPGLYELKVSYLGYQIFIQKAIWVENGETQYLDIKMIPSAHALDEVVVSSNSYDLHDPVSKVSITEEKINRYAATYYDPARLILSSPDVAVSNDQNNQISVRGLSPALNVWRLEGVEIVNPNHLSNAGTFNDQPAATGGGVNILSAQMLDQSEFHIGAMDNTNNNAVAGLFDMDFRNGAADRRYTAQASLIGLDFSAEGPFKEGGKASYLANYRYSFTGLLGLMGVDFGGEVIGFQDLSFNVHIPLKENSSINIFALGGLSSNDFEAKDPNDYEIEKDKSDIHYKGKMGGLGTRYSTLLNRKTQFQFTSLFSSSSQERNQTTYLDLLTVESFLNTAQEESIWSNKAEFARHILNSNWNIGSYYNHYRHSYTSAGTETENFQNDQMLLSPFINWEKKLSQNFSTTLGLTYYVLNSKENWIQALDYRGSISYHKNKTTINLSAGKYSQMIKPGNLFIQQSLPIALNYFEPGFHESYRFLLSLERKFRWADLQVEGFHYLFPNVQIVSRLTWDGTPYQVYLDQESKAQTTGLSIRLQKMTPLFYFDLGASVFNSTYADDMDNPYNIDHSISASLGKKWFFGGNEGEKKVLSINLKQLYQGGTYQAGYQRLSPYQRTDFRVKWSKNKNGIIRSWSLDIQNLLNTQNEGWRYFDTVTGQMEVQYQMGLLPILTYRLEF
ncbi:TonB-dependent receptor [Reichenbachiella ulvae]|uniref:TonB-dependent receptor n=1 Tax=Reichenbachiella ulvae TaxID=2980104 RepID=A0ABT3CNF2_9BACT|nr:TonB-dependent receptor [Reichenbachiella ulvae]MCV9385127.1 TonB-dependent receptor [Reichenbachiella ulvae]